MQLQDDQKQKDFLRKFGDINRKLEEEQTSAASLQFGLPYIDLSAFPVDLSAMALLSRHQAEDGEAVVFFKDGTDLRLGTPNPKSTLLPKYIAEFKSQGLNPRIYFISQGSFKQLLGMYDRVLGKVEFAPDILKVETNNQYELQLKQLSDED